MDKSPEVRLTSPKEETKEEANFTNSSNAHPEEEVKLKDSNGEISGKSLRKQDYTEDDDRYFDLEKLKNIPSYASVLNNPKKNNFLAWIYSASGEKMQPPELLEKPRLTEFQNYIDKMQKSYKRYMKYHKKEESESGHK